MEPVRANIPEPLEAWLAAIVQSSDDAIVGKRLDGTIVSWNPAAERLFGYAAEDAIGQKIFLIAAPGHEDEMPRILERISHGDRIERLETVRRRKDGTLVPVSLTISPVYGSGGEIIGASKIARDISARKALERQLGLLMSEIEHRGRNQLTLACSIVRLSKAASVEDFKSAVTARIIALQQANDQLARNEWRSADLHDLLANVLAAFRSDDGRISFQGPALAVAAECVRPVAMAAHELATNAVKYGALSVPDGRVEVRWRRGAEAPDTLILEWLERGGPPAKTPTTTGLGLSVIELSATRELHGKLDMAWLESGLRCEIVLPARCFATG